MLKINRTLALLAGLATIGMAHAAPVVNGTISAAEYDNNLMAVQANATGFGNATQGIQNQAFGSELNAMYVSADANFLYIGITGNIETNYNKFMLMFDAKAGGQNQLTPPASEQEFGSFVNMVAAPGPLGINNDGTSNGNPVGDNFGPGFKFDAGFNCDYATSLATGPEGFYNHFMIVGQYTPGLNDDGYYLGQGSYGSANGDLANGDAPALGTQIALDNSNTAGVSGDQGAVGDPLTATKGVEFKIPVSVLGGNICDLKLMAIQNGGGMDYLSNQFLPSLPAGTNNLAWARNGDMSAQAGNQYVTVLPSVSGTVNFVGSLATPATTVGYEWLNASGAVIIAEQTTLLTVSNGFKVCGPVKGGNYQLRLKFSKHTSMTIPVNTTSGAVTGTSFSLFNGDIDGDNEVGPSDFDAVVAAFGGNNALEDVDGDGEVGPSDFDIVVANFGVSGS